MDCPYGGKCIDPSNPSDCEGNGGCLCFSSIEEKAAFDARPKSYYVKTKTGEILDFTTIAQVSFYVTDFGGQWVNKPES